jgi:hypothetical protein
VAQIESGSGRNEGALASYYQFEPGTWAAYGQGGTRGTAAGEDAPMNRLTEANYNALSYGLGRAPTQAELYLAHQQGPQGALHLLADPSRRAGDIVGDAAIRGNGGDPNAPAVQFTKMWEAKFNGTPVPAGSVVASAQFPGTSAGAPSIQPASFSPAEVPPPTPGAQNPPPPAQAVPPSPQSIEAEAVRRLEARTDLTEDQKEIAFRHLQRISTAASIAAEEDEKAKKAVKEGAVNEIDGYMLKRDYSGAYAALNANPRLDNEEKLTLSDTIERRSGAPNPVTLGSGYQKIFDRMLLPPDDPNRLSNVMDLYQAENAGDLTAKGTAKLRQVLGDLEKPDEYGLQARVQAAFNQAKERLTFEADYGTFKIRDPNGPEAMNKFTNIFYDEFDKYRRSHPDGEGFSLFQKKAQDELFDQIRPRRQMEMERIASGSETASASPNEAMPQAPDGVRPDAWANIVSNPPMTASGQRAPMASWAAAINRLRSDPSPEMTKAFDEWFGDAGYSAKDILGRLAGAPAPQVPAGMPIPPVGPFQSAPSPHQTEMLDVGHAVNEGAAAIARGARAITPDPTKMTPAQQRQYFGVGGPK